MKKRSLSAQVASYNGWEYAVLERELGAHRDPSRKMLVTVRTLLRKHVFKGYRDHAIEQCRPHGSSALALISVKSLSLEVPKRYDLTSHRCIVLNKCCVICDPGCLINTLHLSLQRRACSLACWVYTSAHCCVRLRAQVIEFESTALMIGQLGVRVSLIAYPVVSIKKARRSLHGRRTCCAPRIL